MKIRKKSRLFCKCKYKNVGFPTFLFWKNLHSYYLINTSLTFASKFCHLPTYLTIRSYSWRALSFTVSYLLISGHFFKKQKIDILPAYFFIFLISYSRLFILILKKSIPSYIILLSKKLTKEECFYEILLQSRKNCK